MGYVARRIEAHGRGTLILLAILALFLGVRPVFGAPPAPAQAAAPAPAAMAAPAAAAQNPSADEFHYNWAGRRDPFKSLLVLQEKKRDVSMLPPIQQVDLATFKVLGIILDKLAGNRAMLQAPDAKTYVIKKGDLIGKNEGEILSIEMNGITVKEKFVDYLNKETNVTTVLKVADKQK